MLSEDKRHVTPLKTGRIAFCVVALAFGANSVSSATIQAAAAVAEGVVERQAESKQGNFGVIIQAGAKVPKTSLDVRATAGGATVTDSKTVSLTQDGNVKVDITRPAGTESKAEADVNATFAGVAGDTAAAYNVLASAKAEVVNEAPEPPGGSAKATVFNEVFFRRTGSGEDGIFVRTIWEKSFRLTATTAGGAAAVTSTGSSSVEGYEDLFSLAVGVSGEDPDILSVDFTSNPALGLDDLAIEASILGQFDYDIAAQSFSLVADAALFAFTLPLSEDIDEASIAFNRQHRARLPGVPLPSGGLMLLPVLGALHVLKRRRG